MGEPTTASDSEHEAESHSKESSRDSSQTRRCRQLQAPAASPHRMRALSVWAKLARRTSGALAGSGGVAHRSTSDGSSDTGAGGSAAASESEQQVMELELVLSTALTLDLRALEPRLDVLLDVCARRREALVAAVRTRFGARAIVLQRAPPVTHTASHAASPSTSGVNKSCLYILFLVPSAAFDSRASSRHELLQQHSPAFGSTRGRPQCFFLLSIPSAVSPPPLSSSSSSASSSAAAADVRLPQPPSASGTADSARPTLKLVVSDQFTSAEALLAQLLPPLAFQHLDSARILAPRVTQPRPAQTLASHLQTLVRFLAHTVCWHPNASGLSLLPRKK